MMRLLCFGFMVAFGLHATAATVSSFDDITFWTGTGSNEAALVIDFNGESVNDPSYVWGFRWDGDQTIEDMLLSVVRNDQRLFVNVDDGTGTFGRTLYGIGYDTNANAEFGITNPQTNFDSQGVAISASATEGIDPTDPGDDYKEGFQLGFWNLGYSVGNPFDGGSWTGASEGISGIISDSSFNPTGEIRYMSNGDWSSLAFNDVSVDGFNTVFAANPFAATAIPEPGSFVFLSVSVAWVSLRRRRTK